MNIIDKINSLLVGNKVEKETDISLLHEKRGYRLFFVSTSANGYFIFENSKGKVFIVGEEYGGIKDEEVLVFFHIDEYGNALVSTK
jgi:tRNA(Leu) C34 or U34 (ribose-2'-O)-methylase TrmL